MRYDYISSRPPLPVFFRALLFFLLPALLSSCFTGVEGTKKITLSKSDIRKQSPLPEEILMDSLSIPTLGSIAAGHRFIVVDPKVALAMEPDRSATPPSAGSTLAFRRIDTRTNPGGDLSAIVVLADSTGHEWRIPSGKSPQAAGATLSSQLPMLVDLGMVADAAALLKGRTVWTRSPLWYDGNGSSLRGRRYVPVTITDVLPGSSSFPLKVAFRDEEGREALMLMNSGNSAYDSRSFANLFYLSDVRSKYPHVPEEVWRLVCDGKVRAGMTKEECRLSLGNPSDVSSGHDYSRTLEIWQYSDGVYLRFADGILVDFRR